MALLPEINTKWRDYSNYGNHGTITGATLKRNGRFGPCLYFDGGVNDVSITYNSSLGFDNKDPITILCWVKMKEIGVVDWLVAQSTEIIVRTTVADRVEFILNSFAPNDRALSTSTFSIDEWFLAGGRYDGTNLEVIVNGNLEGSVVPVGNYGGLIDDFLISSALGRLNGEIDEVMIFNRALAAWEIKALYNMGAP
jgi:hypothetical protein